MSRFAPPSASSSAEESAAAPSPPPSPPPSATAHEQVQEQKSPDSTEKKTIVVDLGHGVIERKKGTRHAGAVHGGVEESAVVEKIGQNLKKALEEKGFRVLLTRGDEQITDNDALQLASRVEVAEAHHADLFVSLHANACSSPKKKGVEIYASREDGGESIKLAETLAQTMKGVSKTAGFAVLKEEKHGTRPAVLVETGYLTNKQERAQLASEEGQRHISLSIAEGIGSYMAQTNLPVASAKDAGRSPS